MGIALSHSDLLSDGTRSEFEHLTARMNGQFDAEHDVDGSHLDLTCDSIATRDTTEYKLPITGNLQILRGGLYIDAVGNSSHVSGLRPPQWTASQDDYNPEGLRDALVVEVDTDADRNLTGIAVVGRQKRLLLFGNRGSHTVTLKHNSSSSIAVHRILVAGAADMALSSGEYVWLWYDVGSTNWRVVGPV